MLICVVMCVVMAIYYPGLRFTCGNALVWCMYVYMLVYLLARLFTCVRTCVRMDGRASGQEGLYKDKIGWVH